MVINGVNFNIKQGETMALVGETGCGKSVTAKSILGVLPSPPTIIAGGKILFHGEDLLRMDKKKLTILRGAKISVIPQSPMTSLNPVFTVGEQLIDTMRWGGQTKFSSIRYLRSTFFDKRENREFKERAIELLDEVKIPSPEVMIDRYPEELSGGMRQRVLIAIALANNPELLIADEAGTALDVTIQNKIIKLLDEHIRERQLSVIYITHNLGVARQIGEKICVMYAGSVVEVAHRDVFFREQMHPYTFGLLKCIPKLTGEMEEGIMGRIPDYVNPPTGCRFHPRCPRRMPICGEKKPFLVEVKPDHLVACHIYS